MQQSDFWQGMNIVVKMSVCVLSGVLDPCGGCGQRGDSASRVLPPEEVRY